ncbi:MAG: hypothetical protein AAFQ04_12750, partial [Pseudomonadota bacterium]
MLQDGLSSVGAINDADPETRAQRYLRRGGQEVGFGLPAAALTGGLANGARMLPVLTASTAADSASAVAGQTAREIAPNNDALDAIASILAGGGTAAASSRALRDKPSPTFGSTGEMFDEAAKIRERVAESGAALTPQAQKEMFDRLYGRLRTERASPRRHPRAFDALEEAQNWPNAGLMDVEETRAIIGRDVASNADEAKVGVALKDEIDTYLKELGENSTEGVVQGADPEGAISDLTRQRQLTHQAHKAAAIEGSQYRAERRAATSGTGGNEVNARRQNIGRILDTEVAPTRSGKRSGYTPDEIEQMERIVFGTPGQNALRWAGKFAPSSGMLPAATTGGGLVAGLAASMATGNPWPMIASVPAGVSEVAKALVERSTRKDIDKLVETIRRGGVEANPKSNATSDVVRALIGVNNFDALPQQ